MIMTNPWVKVGLAAIALAGAAYGGAWVNGARWEAKHNAHLLEDNKAAALAVADRDTRSTALSTDITEVNYELANARAENARLNDCIARGDCGVRIVAAKCPRVPQSGNTAAAGAVTGSPELDPALRPTYAALRDGLVHP